LIGLTAALPRQLTLTRPPVVFVLYVRCFVVPPVVAVVSLILRLLAQPKAVS